MIIEQTMFSITPQTKSNGKIKLTKKMMDEMLQGEALRSLSGILHTDMTVEEIRKERLAKYLK
jgi:hypothetical protein